MRTMRSKDLAMWRPGRVLLVVALVGCSGCSWIGGPAVSAEQQIAEGRALYEANGCATCHGAEGRGDGPVTRTLHSSPRDFRDPAAFVNGYNAEQIARTLQTGLVEGDQTMPSYAHLSENDRKLLAVFVRSLRADSKRSSNDEPQ
jgi:mono/diheme cytochrome c family protein